MNEAQIAVIRAELGQGAAAVRVWRQNLRAVLAFLVSCSQWRTALQPVEGRLRQVWIGLDYTAAKVSIEGHGMAIDPGLWAGLRTMENGALDALNGVDL